MADLVAAGNASRLVFVCNEDNDVLTILGMHPTVPVLSFRSLAQALPALQDGDGVLLLAGRWRAKLALHPTHYAETYPEGNDVAPDALLALAQKNVSLFYEFPLSLPGINYAHTVSSLNCRDVRGVPCGLCDCGDYNAVPYNLARPAAP